MPLGWKERCARMLEFRPRELAALAVLALLVAGGAAFAFARSLPKAAEPPPPAATEAATETIAPAESTEAASLSVHVAGAVRAPGVYTFPPGARVADAITAAGGATAGADPNAINLARPLTDGERVYVPRKGETPPPDPSAAGGDPAASGGKVNINTASAAQLEALPGIGPALAQRIVDYRDKHGPFASPRDLMKVQGIGEKKFAGLEEYVTV